MYFIVFTLLASTIYHLLRADECKERLNRTKFGDCAVFCFVLYPCKTPESRECSKSCCLFLKPKYFRRVPLDGPQGHAKMEVYTIFVSPL